MNATDKKILVDGLKNGNPSKAIYEFILERTKDPNFDTITDRKQGEKQIRELL